MFAPDGIGSAFSEVAGCVTALADLGGRFGGGLIAALAQSGSFMGDGSIRRIGPDGTAGPPLASGMPGIHAIAIAPEGGALGGDMVAARWDPGELLRVTPDGAVSVIAGGLVLVSTDANIIAASPDGDFFIVSDRLTARLICVEPLPER